MEQVKRLLEEALNENLEQMILSNPAVKEKGSKVKVRPVLIKQELAFQETLYRENKVYHVNCDRQ